MSRSVPTEPLIGEDYFAVALILCLAVTLLGGACARQSAPTVDTSPGAAEKGSVPPLPEGSWRFIVSGDSRNCGDIVMPAIASHSAQFTPNFYWHLGDLRATYKIDEDMAFEAQIKVTHSLAAFMKDWPGPITASTRLPPLATFRFT